MNTISRYQDLTGKKVAAIQGSKGTSTGEILNLKWPGISLLGLVITERSGLRNQWYCYSVSKN